MDIQPIGLINKLKNGEELPNIFLLLGEETYYRQKILNALKETVFQGVAEADREIHVFDRDINLNAVEQAVNSYPFFSGRSMVILAEDKFFDIKGKTTDEGLAGRLEPLLKIVENMPDFCTLVISVVKFNHSLKVFKTMRSKGVLSEAETIKPGNLAPWLKATAAERGGKFDSSGIIKIMEYLAPADTAPLDLLGKEIDKLVLYAGKDRAWTEKDVEDVFSDLPQLGVFKLTEAIGQHNLLQAIRYLRIEQKKPNSRGEIIIGQLLWKLRTMIRVMELQQGGKSAKEMEPYFPDTKNPGWLIRNTLASLRGFEITRLVKAFKDLGRINGDARFYGFSQDRIFDRIEEILVELLTKE